MNHSVLQIELAAKAAYEARRERVFKAGSGEAWDWQDITPVAREMWREVALAVFAWQEDEA